ncbi:MAG: hypothetical protein ACJ72Z_00260 [Pyrinomonadaceae bacterium]
MKEIRQHLLGILFLIPLGGMVWSVSAQTASRWTDEKNQERNEEETKSSARETFRVYRGEHFYVTDYRGVELLRNGINEGYRRGFLEGEKDYQNRSYTGYRASETFKDGSIGYKNYIDLDEYQYYFRRGFELGYYDGFDGFVRYGRVSDGNRTVLESVVSGVLDIRRY